MQLVSYVRTLYVEECRTLENFLQENPVTLSLEYRVVVELICRRRREAFRQYGWLGPRLRDRETWQRCIANQLSDQAAQFRTCKLSEQNCRRGIEPYVLVIGLAWCVKSMEARRQSRYQRRAEAVSMWRTPSQVKLVTIAQDAEPWLHLRSSQGRGSKVRSIVAGVLPRAAHPMPMLSAIPPPPGSLV